jgi:hypothetical protein
MEQEKILKLFKQFAGDVIDIHGLKLTPTAIGKRTKRLEKLEILNVMYFDISNPNQLSYFTPLVEEELNDVVVSFEGYINEKIFVKFNDDVKKGLVLNNKTIKEIKQVFDELPFISFQVWVGQSNDPTNYRIYGKNIDISTNWDNDEFSINNIFKPTKATCDGEVADIKEVLEYYDDFLQGVATYWESENHYSKIDSIITKYPLLNADWIATYYDTKII